MPFYEEPKRRRINWLWFYTTPARALANFMWLLAGLLMIVLTGYRLWDTYTQRQNLNAYVEESRARNRDYGKRADRELARFKRMNDIWEKGYRTRGVKLGLQPVAPRS